MRTMLRKALLPLVALAVLAAVVGTGGRHAWAASHAKRVDVLRRDGDITILPNGDVRVVETWEVQFIGGTFHYAYREIPLNHVEDITDWGVAEGSRQFVQSDSAEPYTFSLSPEDGAQRITWYFPELNDETHTFTLSYTLKQALWIDEDGDQFFWKFIEADRSYPIESSTVTVHLPGEFNPSSVKTLTYMNAEEGPVAQMLNKSTVRFRGGPFPGGTEWEIRVQWPHGFVSASPPPWQRKMELQPWITLGWWVIVLLSALALAGGAFLLWYLRGRDPEIGAVPQVLPAPPSKLPAGMVGTLIDERADMDDVMGTLLDLARRGFLRIEVERVPVFIGTKEQTYFVAEQWPEQPLPFERALLKGIFGSVATPGERVSLESLKNNFYTHLPYIKGKLYEAVVAAKLFPTRPDRTRQRYIFLSVLASGALSLLYFPASWMGAQSAAIGAMVLGGMLFVALIPFANAMPRKTKIGALEAAKWRAFKRYLQTLERHTALEQAKDLFEQYLPYATAFGISKTWVRKFARVADMPVPRWYWYQTPGMPMGSAQGGHMAAPAQPCGRLVRFPWACRGSDTSTSAVLAYRQPAQTFAPRFWKCQTPWHRADTARTNPSPAPKRCGALRFAGNA